ILSTLAAGHARRHPALSGLRSWVHSWVQMGRQINRLPALKVSRALKPGMYHDGAGLYLQVTPRGKSWVYRCMLNGGAREMGLGSASNVTLADARTKAAEYRRLRDEGIDPIENRKAARARVQLDAAKAITFKKAAESYIAARRAGWQNDKHAAQWGSTLAT